MTDLELLGPRLHDRATRGQTLTQEETDALRAWYAQQDQAEPMPAAPAPGSDIAALQEQVDQTLAQLARTAQQIRRLDKENAVLRRENARLRAQLSGQTDLLPA